MTKIRTNTKEKTSHKIIYYVLVTYAAILSAIFVISFSILLYTLITDPGATITGANFGYLEGVGYD